MANQSEYISWKTVPGNNTMREVSFFLNSSGVPQIVLRDSVNYLQGNNPNSKKPHIHTQTLVMASSSSIAITDVSQEFRTVDLEDGVVVGVTPLVTAGNFGLLNDHTKAKTMRDQLTDLLKQRAKYEASHPNKAWEDSPEGMAALTKIEPFVSGIINQAEANKALSPLPAGVKAAANNHILGELPDYFMNRRLGQALDCPVR